MLSQNKIVSENVVRILSYLKRDINGSFSIRRISKETKLSYNSCYKTIQSLKEINVILLRKEGGVNYCSLTDSPKAKLLLSYVSLLETEMFLLNKTILKKILKELIDKFNLNIDFLVLFGSFAKGKEKKGSDIDLLCVSSERNKIQSYVRHLAMKYDKDIQVIVANKEDFAKMLDEEKVNVGKEARDTGIVLHGYESFWGIVLKR
ncbi:MAG: nucleotidyltransferase domain-containing protein [Nanoarchaeota archaeon]|nr:nucleotidyltransferase domain-containing protein [Nanoarchaeota archaeon]